MPGSEVLVLSTAPRCLLTAVIQHQHPHSGDSSKLASQWPSLGLLPRGLPAALDRLLSLFAFHPLSPLSFLITSSVSVSGPSSPCVLASSLILAPDHGSLSDSCYSTRPTSVGQVSTVPGCILYMRKRRLRSQKYWHLPA